MKINTTRFGEIQIEEENIFTFPQGVPGFEKIHQYVIIQAAADTPFYFMQAIQEPDLAFIIADPFLFYPEYQFDLSKEVEDELNLQTPDDVKVWAIVTFIAEQGAKSASINLLAPIVFNNKSKIGKQVILLEKEYHTRHPLFTDDK